MRPHRQLFGVVGGRAARPTRLTHQHLGDVGVPVVVYDVCVKGVRADEGLD